jgi:hypothetical protein
MSTPTEILDKLRRLNLSSYPVTEVQELIRRLGKNVFLIFTLHYGKVLTRARPGNGYTHVSELTYLPQDKNKKYQRASTPNRTMFYGTIVQDGESLETTRMIAACECSSLLRGGKDTKGIESITYGRWSVIRDINLVVILSEDVYADAPNNPLLQELQDALTAFIRTAPETEESAKFIANFFANEFAKKDIQDDFDYFLSAIFTEIITNDLGFDGVMYPSVQSGGQWGFNVAIKPETVDNNMILDIVLETILYKNEECALLLDDKISGLSTWELVDTPQLSQEEICKHLHIDSLNEITDK